MRDFLWGVATSAYQSEGGYNGFGQPQTNWASAEHQGEVAESGLATDFWNRYSEDFERCRKSGINAFRLGIEWSRVQPTFSNQKGARLLLIIRHDRRRLDPLRLFSLSLRTGRINRQFVWINRLHPESPSDSPRETTLRIEPDFTRSTNRCTA